MQTDLFTINTVLMANRGCFYFESPKVSPSTSELREEKVRLLMAIQAEISEYGYILDSTLFASFLDEENGMTYGVFDITTFREELHAFLKTFLGADVKYLPIFRKFPDKVPDDTEYLIRRVLGYLKNASIETQVDAFNTFRRTINSDDTVTLSNGIVVDKVLFDMDEFNACPITQMQTLELSSRDEHQETPLNDSRLLKSIALGGKEDILEVFSNLIASNTPISDRDKAFITAVFSIQGEDAFSALPDEIPQKETIVLVSQMLVKSLNYKEASALLSSYIKTATDVLRLAEGFSGGEPSLTEHESFKLTSKERKIVMSLLNKIKNPEEDMLRYRGLWLVLGQYLHIAAYRRKFSRAVAYMNKLRNDPESIMTYNKRIEDAISMRKKDDVIRYSIERSGDFARRLDHILRMFDSDEDIAKAFLSVADNVATPLLVNLKTFMQNRHEKDDTRLFTPKGTLFSNVEEGDSRPTLSMHVCQLLSVGISRVLTERFAERESLGNVFIDAGLRDILVASSMRGDGEQTQPLTKGSRIAFQDDEANILRMFCYWKETDCGRVDVDISLMAFDENLEHKESVSYSNYNNSGAFTYSGDEQSAPYGASEFIDADIEKCLAKGLRYLIMTTNVYTGQRFSKFTAMGGFMTRRNTSGKAFEPKTVEHKYNIFSNTNFAFPMAFDLVERKMVWIDVGISAKNACENIVSKSQIASNILMDALNEHKRKTSLYNLFSLHALGRATYLSISDQKLEELTQEELDSYDYIFDMSMMRKADEIMSVWLK